MQQPILHVFYEHCFGLFRLERGLQISQKGPKLIQLEIRWRITQAILLETKHTVHERIGKLVWFSLQSKFQNSGITLINIQGSVELSN